MRAFTCTDHDGYWSVGVASVVIAADEDEARLLLTAELSKSGLHKEPFTLQEIDLTTPQAIVLRDGNY
ncbi:hypothetical protein [Microvirga pudoricolor]|uniref:hypothetical protein n=1 Tax=Microvirga pudoricolor TaxID=2778729 RepID=UPI0019520E86|nr:hypothetical protein [Microvirga pudoricolor]MBM6595574.1 hypothetical protein [Microvirga pudoricolor]